MAKKKIATMSTPEKDTLLMIYKHDEGPNRYSLYSLSLEEEDRRRQEEEEENSRRPAVTTLLLEMSREEYPVGMGFIFMEKLNTLYMIGGQFQKDGVVYSSRKVYAVDLSPPQMDKLTTTSSSSSSGPFLSVQEAPMMLSGKSNPIVVEAHGRIYVLGSACRDSKCLGPVKAETEAQQGVTRYNEDPALVFEVFEFQTIWSALPGPSFDEYNKSPYYSSTAIQGCAVVNDLIILHDIDGNKFLAFHIVYREWMSFSYLFLPTINSSSLLLNLVKCGFRGRGVVIDGGTLFTFTHGDELAAHDISTTTAYVDMYYLSSFLGLVQGVEFPFTCRYESSGGLLLQGGSLVYLGRDRLCCVACDYHFDIIHPKSTREVSVTIFSVNKDGSSSGKTLCRANLLDSYVLEGINTELGSILYCFALRDKMEEDRFGWLSKWTKYVWKIGEFVAESALTAGVPIILGACSKFLISQKTP